MSISVAAGIPYPARARQQMSEPARSDAGNGRRPSRPWTCAANCRIVLCASSSRFVFLACLALHGGEQILLEDAKKGWSKARRMIEKRQRRPSPV